MDFNFFIVYHLKKMVIILKEDVRYPFDKCYKEASMEFRQLRIFCEAAATLNYTKAGENLGYSQSNVTGQMQLLEDELGVRLF